MNIGDKIIIPYRPTCWERIKSFFGYEIPKEKTYTVKMVKA